jgi:hypothetical protein
MLKWEFGEIRKVAAGSPKKSVRKAPTKARVRKRRVARKPPHQKPRQAAEATTKS